MATKATVPTVKASHVRVAVRYLGHLLHDKSLFWLKAVLAVNIPLGVGTITCLFVVGIWEWGGGRDSFLRHQKPELGMHKKR